jgi:hypothetical protein
MEVVMKRIRSLILIVVSLSLAPFAFADGVSIEIGATPALGNIVSANNAALAVSVDPYVNATYAIKIDDSTTLKLGLALDGNFNFGNFTASTVPFLADVYPNASLTAGNLSATVAFPILFWSPNTSAAAGLAISKGFGYYTKANAAASVLIGNYDKVSYKIKLDDTFSITPTVEAELSLMPFAFVDVKPDLTVGIGPVSVDAKASIYFASATTTNVYLDPKATLDFGTLGVKGLKAWVGASVPVYTTATAALTGISITPGVGYKLDAFYVEANFKLGNVELSSLYFSPSLKLSYTLSF